MKWADALPEDEKLELQNIMLLEPMAAAKIISADAFNRLARRGLIRFTGRFAVVLWEHVKLGPLWGKR